MSGKRAGYELFLISFLTLFAELVFIRYLSSNIYLLSFYKNSVIIAVFLGMGTGFMLSKDRGDYVKYLPLATLVLVSVIVYFNDYLRIDLDYSSMDESIWPEFWANRRAASVPIFWVLVSIYVMTALYFVPFGQETVRAMSFFRPLTAYSINVAGSLSGVVLFEVLGALWTTPLVWFAVISIPLLWWGRRYSGRLVFALNAVSTVLALFIVFSAVLGPELWSPYSKIRVYQFAPDPALGFISTTNGNPQVGCINLDASYKGPEGPLNMESRSIYEIPYAFMRPASVLVAGAGAGNEVAVALKHGAGRVEAIELDPVFIALGRALNPHRPFDDRRVFVHVGDARAFFHRTGEKYELVVIGFLDSQYHLTHMSNIRTENFVYTWESLKRTKDILTPGGVLQLNYNSPRIETRERIYAILKDVYGEDLIAFVPENPVSGNISFVAGPGVRGLGKAGNIPGLKRVSFNNAPKNTEIPTDDWPFLYLSGRKVPREYWPMLATLPLLSLAFIRAVGGKRTGFSPKYFLLGSGFMLLETKSITTFALLFGSTVTVVAVVVASILVAILLANLVIHKFSIRSLTTPYVLTLSSLIGLYFVPTGALLHLSMGLKLTASILLISAPLFFAAIVFGVSFAGSKDQGTDLGSNIFGAVSGGMLEYSSMAFGFKSLYILSFLGYLLAFITDIAKGKGAPEGGAGGEGAVVGEGRGDEP